jgi:cell division protein FtsL
MTYSNILDIIFLSFLCVVSVLILLLCCVVSSEYIYILTTHHTAQNHGVLSSSLDCGIVA